VKILLEIGEKLDNSENYVLCTPKTFFFLKNPLLLEFYLSAFLKVCSLFSL